MAVRVALGRRSLAESGFADLPYDEEKVRRGLERGLAAPKSHCLLQAEFAGETVGVLYGVRCPAAPIEGPVKSGSVLRAGATASELAEVPPGARICPGPDWKNCR